MNSHHKIRLMLYDFLQDDLPPSDRQTVEAHVASCRECLKELNLMRSTLGMLDVPASASENRPEKYWSDFAATVAQKAISQESERKNPFVETIELLEGLFALHPAYTFAATGTLAALLVVFAMWTFHTPEDHGTASNGTFDHRPTPASSPGESLNQSAASPERVSQYFRKSKTLLVGLANLKPDQDEPLDFSTERRISRDLVREARYLKLQPIDPRSRRLMTDMESILIGLSNIDGHKDLSHVEMIRSGIHHENLLFKIRMAEAMYDSSNFVYASNRQQE